MKKRLLFKAGTRYPLSSMTCLVERLTTKPNLEGGADEILLNGQELVFGITGEDGNEYRFIDGRHIREGISITATGSSTTLATDYDLQHLLEHFEIPEVKDVASSQPENYDRYRNAMAEIQRFINEQVDSKFRFRKFQFEDYCRAALHDGCVLAHSTGLGKSICAIVFSLLKVGVHWERSRKAHGLIPLKPVLIVAPENLHDQLEAEWKRRFGIHTVRLDSQDGYLELRDEKLGNRLPAGFYLTSYTKLGMNKIKELPVPTACPRTFADIGRLTNFYGVSIDDVRNYKLNKDFFTDDVNPLLEKAIAACNYRYEHFSRNVGEYGEKNKAIKCIFSPSLADLCGHEFECIVIDEGIRIKGEDTIIGRAVRELDPKYRLVLTATPIKNRLRDLFFLLIWAAGGGDVPTARCPYTNEDQEKFTAEYNVCERNLSAEARAAKERGERAVKKRKKKSRGRPGVQVCNIHRLWKFIAPIILRRRKEDIGEDIVAKRKQIIRAPLGAKQYEVYKYHLSANYVDKNGKPAYMAKLQALRSAAAAPNSELLKQIDPEFEGVPNGLFRSETDYTPKMAACLTLIEQRLRAGEQTVVGSALHEPLDTLSKRLTEAGIPHDVLDGRVSAKKRGQLGAEFKAGLPKAKPVLLCGMKSMGEGNNWPLCNNAVTVSYDWAYDTNEQWPDRCHRLDSVKDLNVWPIICEGSIDRKLEAGYDEKGDASELVLDGQLLGEDVQEVNLPELLRIAEEDFRHATTYPEEKLEAEWPALMAKLADAWKFAKRSAGQKARYQPTVNPSNPIPLARLLERIKEMQAA